MPFRFGPWEIGLIVLIILIVFGAGKLPEIGGAIGKGLRQFRKEQDQKDNLTDVTNTGPRVHKAKKGT